jgi:hypothetical protein
MGRTGRGELDGCIMHRVHTNKKYFIKIENIISLFSYIIIIQFLTPYLLEVNYEVYFHH